MATEDPSWREAWAKLRSCGGRVITLAGVLGVARTSLSSALTRLRIVRLRGGEGGEGNALFERAELFGAAHLEVLVDGGWGNV